MAEADKSVPALIRGLARLLSGEQEMMAAIAWAQSGRVPEKGDSIAVEYDLAYISRLLELCANWADATSDLVDAQRGVGNTSDRLIEGAKARIAAASSEIASLEEARERVLAPKRTGGRQSGKSRAEASSNAKTEAKRLIDEYREAGHDERDIAGKVASRVGRSAAWVRAVKKETKAN